MAVGTPRLAEENLRLTLADCAAFRTLVGAANRAAALSSIHLYALPAPADAKTYTAAELETHRNYAIVRTERCRWRRTATETELESGQISVELVRTTAGATLSARLSDWLDKVGEIVGQMWALSYQAGQTESYLVIEDIDLADHGAISEMDGEEITIGKQDSALLQVSWGNEG